MAIRPIYDNSVEALQRLVRDLNDEIAQLRSGNNLGKRSANAADAVQPDDLVTKRQLEVVVDRLRQVEANPRRTRAGTGTTAPPTTGLPKATHYIAFGYYFGKTRYDEFKGWTTGYWAGAGEDNYPMPPDEWMPILGQRVTTAAGDNKGIVIQWEHSEPDTFVNVMRAIETFGDLAIVWPRVKSLIFADETGVDPDTLEAWIQDIRDIIRSYNLAVPPLGITQTKNQMLNGNLLDTSVDFIGVEAYVDPPGDPDPQVNIDGMVNWLRQAKDLVPATKQICFIMQGYNRNGAWPNETTLAALQTPVYLEAWNDPRVDQILIFAWDRARPDLNSYGSRDLPKLIAEHKRIYAALQGATTQELGCKRQSTGAFLQQQWFEGFDLCIVENFGTLFYNPGDGTYVIAGQEAAARDAIVEVLNRPQWGTVSAAAFPIPPYGDTDIFLKPLNSTEFSETFTPFASNGKCRLAGGYIETCRPAKF